MKNRKMPLGVLMSAVLVCGMLTSCSAQTEQTSDEEEETEVQTLTIADDEYYSRFRDKGISINVYNWGEYISDGSDEGTIAVNSEFTKLTGIKVNYTNYATNEELYAKLKGGGASYDIIIPSDYMISRMIKENMIQKLDFDNIPNFKYITESFVDPAYDPENEYSVPYTWGTVGIIYDTTMIDIPAEEIDWDILWNEKYSGKILMFDNSRDAFGIAEYLLGYSANTTDEAELQACADKLAEQKPVVQQYVMDQIFDAMENEEAWIAPYYAGDYLTMVEENPDLAFYRPTTQGYNMFIDAMCIPTCCQEKEAAEAFINFLCSPEISSANMEFLGYSVPSTAAKELMDPEVAGSEVAYPDADTLTTGTSFNFLPEETSRYMESLFMEVRNG